MDSPLIGQQPQQTKINLADVDDIDCDKCGNRTFEQVVMLKKLSKLISPSGNEEIIPLEPPICPPMYACFSCGHVNDIFIPAPLKATRKTASAPVAPSPILGLIK